MTAKDLYVKDGFNCSEAVVRAMNEKLSLGISENDLNLVSGFGGGMGCSEACGALCGCIAVISKLAVKDKAHKTEGFGPLCAGFVKLFNETLGGINCRDVKPVNFTPELRCGMSVEKAEKILLDYLLENKLI